MTITVNTDTVIYDRLMQTSYLERIQDVLEAFNAASAGAMVLRSEAIEGDENKSAFYTLDASVVDRDVNDVTDYEGTPFGAAEMITVKKPWLFEPVESTEESFKRRNRSPSEHFVLAGQQMADHVIQHQIQCAFAALAAAIGENSDMVASGDFATDGHKVLTKGLRTLGDRASRVAVWGMDSGAYFDLVDNAITEKLYEEAGVVVYGGSPGTMGKPVLVTDQCPADTIFGLQTGAVEIVESQAPGVINERLGGRQNIIMRSQGEGAFNVGILGYSWDGSANPTLAEVGTGANWVKYAQSNKATAGFIIDISGESQ